MAPQASPEPEELKSHGKLADLFYVSSLPETQVLDGPAALAAMVRDFEHDAVAHRKRIGETLQHQPEAFYLTTVEILKKDIDSRAAQYLIMLLVSNNLLFRALCDPALDRIRAAELARRAFRVDPMVDIRVARQLADSGTDGTGGVAIGMAERLMEILDEISDGRRVLRLLMRMLRTENPYLRSKAVLMIGRSGRSLNWMKSRWQETDTRVRANAIEALWGMDTAEARGLLQCATRDRNSRVVGNALVGLYRLGENSPLPDLVRMACHDSASSRRTAAWVMGKTGDPRFSEVLGRMIADSNGGVRKNAFAALGRIRAAVAQVSQAAEWPVAGYCRPKDPHGGQRRVSVAVLTADGSESPRVLPVQFMLSENGQLIWSYRVIEKPPPEAMSVIFLFPRKAEHAGKPWDPGALRCLNWKRTADLWSTVPYSGVEDRRSGGPADLELPSFIVNSARAARASKEASERTDCTGFWTAVHRAVLPGKTPVRGKRHMIVLVPDEVGDNVDASLIAAVYASRTSIQVVSTSANPALQEFCSRIDGVFHLVADIAAIEERISLVYLSLLARYEICYLPVCADAVSLRLRVHTPAGWGETMVPLP